MLCIAVFREYVSGGDCKNTVAVVDEEGGAIP